MSYYTYTLHYEKHDCFVFVLKRVIYIIARNLVLTDVKEEPKTTVMFINTQYLYIYAIHVIWVISMVNQIVAVLLHKN